jgi:GGDEF domain-containing protein
MSVPVATQATASPRSRVSDRNALFAALGSAVLPGSEASVLVLFGFAGLKEYAELVSLEAGDSLLDWLGGRIAWAIGDEGQLFHTRRCEFFALLNGRLGSFHELLVRIRADLDEVGRPFEVRSFLGFAVLPDEAKLPTLAVVRADERLKAMIGDVRPEGRSTAEPDPPDAAA